MTKKHFIALADAIREPINTGTGLEHLRNSPFTQAQIERLADFCGQQNDRLQEMRWKRLASYRG